MIRHFPNSKLVSALLHVHQRVNVLKRLKNEVTLGQGCVVDCCGNGLQFVHGFLVPMSWGSPLLQ